MATKSYKLRLDLRADQRTVDSSRFASRPDEIVATRRLLDDTREAFNAGVDYLTGWLLRMHRGAGVYREKRDGIWRKWREITTHEKLRYARKRFKEARKRPPDDPTSFALIENPELLKAFRSNGKSEAEAVKLAECCRMIAKQLCPPSEDSTGAQMPRDSLDLLLNPKSRALGVRKGPVHLKWQLWRLATESTDASQWEDKLKEVPELLEQSRSSKRANSKNDGRRLRNPVETLVKEMLKTEGDWQTQRSRFFDRLDRPEWLRNQVLANNAPKAASREQLIELLLQSAEFQGNGGTRHIDRLKKEAESKKSQTWQQRQTEIIDNATREVRDYQSLYDSGCLPLPGFGRNHDDNGVILGPLTLTNVGSEWKRSMWDMAGQRVRSHLGWVDRRARERVLWELRSYLFECGGWILAKRNGKKIKNDDLASDDFRFEAPPDQEATDFEQRPGYSDREWFKTLRTYENEEMSKHLEDVAFGAAEQPRIRKRTAKGWVKVRDKWLDLIAKASKNEKPAPTADDLLEAFDTMRSRKTRDFGDRRLFEWLADPKRRSLWDRTDDGEKNDCGRDDRDCVSAFIAHNEHLADKPDSITFTRSDSVKHPVWPFFGENSAVKYSISQEISDDGKSRLILTLKQLLSRQDDGSYKAVDNVRIALRGYADFEKSFAIPDEGGETSATQKLVFRDDLLGGKTRPGTLNGMKLTWDREELEASNRKRRPTKKPPRIYANFSCNAGDATLPEWLAKHVGSDIKLKKPRDGMTRVFFLKKSISKDAATEDGGTRLQPGERTWPKEAIENGFTVRGTDLGFRTSSAGAWWKLSSTKPKGTVAWRVGTCDGKSVYAVLERTGTVSLPGDGESLPPHEQALRDRLYALRTRLNLNNALLRIARLLALEAVTQRKPNGDRIRKRSDGTTKRVGIRWKSGSRSLSEQEIRDNCRKAADQLVRWASSDAMKESLKAIGQDDESLWDWLGSHDQSLLQLGELAPTTEVPTQTEAKKQNIDRDACKSKRKQEDDAFADAAFEARLALAKALCDGHDAGNRRRATFGLWYELDAALMRELSYGDRGKHNGERTIFENGLFRLLRKPPVTKHRDRKDEANNLPHGRTHRGGLSMARLNFLDDIKNFIRRWSCRPRWPGDVRRVPADAKFDRCDTEHLDHLREHRAKLIAHADIAQTLGFEQDLRRGVWKFKVKKSDEEFWHRPERGHFYRERGKSLVQCSPPDGLSDDDAKRPHTAHDAAHVLVYEDLTRYKMSSDRPKNENAGLARWSHRRILAFAQHIGGLFGVPVATVDARFSSRFCSHCGAPGCRAEKFDPEWLNQSWMQRILQSTDIRDAALKSVAHQVRENLRADSSAYNCDEMRPWVLRDGGSYFVCANKKCAVHATPINADENAAGNIGLRFLRGIDGIRVTINGNGTVTRSIGYLPPGTVLAPAAIDNSSGNRSYWRDNGNSAASASNSRRRKKSGSESAPANEIEDDDETGGVRILFRDPSGGLLPPDHWFESEEFWGRVKATCQARIEAANAAQFGAEEESG